MSLFRNLKIFISESEKHGFGVFTNQKLISGELIEETPYIELTCQVDSNIMKYTLCDSSGQLIFIPLGSCTVLNSSKNANVEYLLDSENRKVIFKAKFDIEPGEELFLSYGFD